MPQFLYGLYSLVPTSRPRVLAISPLCFLLYGHLPKAKKPLRVNNEYATKIKFLYFAKDLARININVKHKHKAR